MQVIKIRRRDGDVFVPHHFPSNITNNGKSLSYWIYGEGHKRTNSFEIMDEKLPDKWARLPWLDIMYIHEKYGINVSEEYANRKVAGIVARQNVRSRYALFEKIKQLLDSEKDREFFELLKTDYMLSCFGCYTIDIVATDDEMSKADPEYDSENATYKGETCSMKQYVKRKFGERRQKIFNTLLKT